MKIYLYKAFDFSGTLLSGETEASSEKEAIEQLKRSGLFVSEIKEKVEGLSFGFTKKLNLADIEFLTSELSLLLESGVKIDKGIDIIKKSKANSALSKLLNDISGSLKSGDSLSVAFGKHPSAFDSLYVNLIEIGESTGKLASVFKGLAKDLKYKRELQRKIIQSLTYPSVILFVCVLSVLFVFNFIVPQMSSLFADANELPWYTEVLLDSSTWMQKYQFVLAGGLVAMIVVTSSFRKSEHFQKNWQKLLLQISFIRNSVLTVERIRFNSSLSLMLISSVAMDKALELATKNIKNRYLQRDVDIARKKIKRGATLSNALKQTALYPDFFVSLLEVGEESGRLDRIFEEIADRSRQDFEEWTQRVTTLIEPILILLMGAIIGGVVIVMLLSMVSVNDIVV